MITNFRKYSLYSSLTSLYILLYSAFLISTFFTVHTHKLPDGRIVSHSHFSLNGTKEKTESGTSSHSHKEIEFIYIVSTKDFHLLIADIFKLNSVKEEFELKFADVVEQIFYNDCNLYSNKSPPNL